MRRATAISIFLILKNAVKVVSKDIPTISNIIKKYMAILAENKAWLMLKTLGLIITKLK
jgi:hypothetical protein